MLDCQKAGNPTYAAAANSCGYSIEALFRNGLTLTLVKEYGPDSKFCLLASGNRQDTQITIK
jgi:hypothetical protein